MEPGLESDVSRNRDYSMNAVVQYYFFAVNGQAASIIG